MQKSEMDAKEGSTPETLVSFLLQRVPSFLIQKQILFSEWL